MKSNLPIKDTADKQTGFSLIEVMITMVIFFIFMSAVYGVLRIGNIQKTTVGKQTEVIKNARISMNTIGRDAVNAGFGYSRGGGTVPDNFTNLRMGLPADTDIVFDTLTAIVAGNNINANTLSPGNNTDVVSFISRDINFNNGDPITFVGAADNSGSGVTITTEDNGTVNSNPYDLYVVSDGARTTLGIVTAVPSGGKTLIFETGGADPLGINAPYTGSVDERSKLRSCTGPTDSGCFDYSNIVTAKKVNWISYGVDAEGSMTRTTYGNNTGQAAANQIQVQAIAYRIQNFQVRYLLRDGSVSDDPSNGGTNPTNLNNVILIDIVVSAEVTSESDGIRLVKIVDLRSTFSTKNLNYDVG